MNPLPLAGYPGHPQAFWKILYGLFQALPNLAYYFGLGLILDTLEAVLENINRTHDTRDKSKLAYIIMVCFGLLGIAEALTTEAFFLQVHR